jgi:hypothetical protein
MSIYVCEARYQALSVRGELEAGFRSCANHFGRALPLLRTLRATTRLLAGQVFRTLRFVDPRYFPAFRDSCSRGLGIIYFLSRLIEIPKERSFPLPLESEHKA